MVPVPVPKLTDVQLLGICRHSICVDVEALVSAEIETVVDGSAVKVVVEEFASIDFGDELSV